RLIPFLFLLYIVAYLDRVNVGFAALQMNQALGFSATTYGFGAGIFFLSYVLFEIPSNVILARVGARLWIARIMITWGLVSSSMMFVRNAYGFYVLRFVLEGLLSVALGLVVLRFLTERPEGATWLSAGERATLIACLQQEEHAQQRKTTRETLGNPRTWLLGVVYFTIPVTLYGIGFWLPLILKRASGSSDFVVGLLTAIPSAEDTIAMDAD